MARTSFRPRRKVQQLLQSIRDRSRSQASSILAESTKTPTRAGIAPATPLPPAGTRLARSSCRWMSCSICLPCASIARVSAFRSMVAAGAAFAAGAGAAASASVRGFRARDGRAGGSSSTGSFGGASAALPRRLSRSGEALGAPPAFENGCDSLGPVMVSVAVSVPASARLPPFRPRPACAAHVRRGAATRALLGVLECLRRRFRRLVLVRWRECSCLLMPWENV